MWVFIVCLAIVYNYVMSLAEWMAYAIHRCRKCEALACRVFPYRKDRGRKWEALASKTPATAQAVMVKDCLLKQDLRSQSETYPKGRVFF